MTTLALPQRPNVQTGYGWLDAPIKLLSTFYWLAIQMPLHTIKVYPPIFLLALVASYASAQFASHHAIFPPPLNWALGVAFEWVYLGAISIASSRTGKWYMGVVLAGALTSVCYIMLYAASMYGLMGQLVTLLPSEWVPLTRLLITLVLIAAHSVPITALAVLYNFLTHAHLQAQAEADHIAALHRQFTCSLGCGASFTSEPALRGHKGHCPNKV